MSKDFEEVFEEQEKMFKKLEKTLRRIFGFEKVDERKYWKSPELNEIQVVRDIVKLQTDMNWVKRIIWLLVASQIYLIGRIHEILGKL
jgi:hypothetical protein